MIRTQIYLSPDQRDRILDLAAAQKRTMADVIREAVAQYLVERCKTDDPLLDIVALGESGVVDGAEQHDRDVYGPEPA